MVYSRIIYVDHICNSKCKVLKYDMSKGRMEDNSRAVFPKLCSAVKLRRQQFLAIAPTKY